MSVLTSSFGALSGGQPVTRYTIVNRGGARASFLDYGATWQEMLVPDRTGQMTDVVLGYDTAAEYAKNSMYFGATIGRVANRIKGAGFTLEGHDYRLAANDGGSCIHGGTSGFDKAMWNAKTEEQSVIFSRFSPDGEEGFPGDLSVMVSFTLYDDNTLSIRYFAVSSKTTVLNLTNHAYFHLGGQGSGPVTAHTLMIDADQFTRTGPDIVPTGEIVPVRSGPLDFTVPKPIGRDIDACVEQMDTARGYDHNFVLNHPEGGVERFARTFDPASGIAMEAYTDQPGVQLYTPASLGGMCGKQGAVYGDRPAFCLETQHFPDAMAHPDFPSIVLLAGDIFTSETFYRFSAEASRAAVDESAV